ncbi:hypothetical protein ACFFRR_007811 [Megaselia abdita]
MSSSIAFEIPKEVEDLPPSYDESVKGGRSSPFEEKPLDDCSFQVNIEGEPNMEIVTEIDCKTGKPKMMYVVRKTCSHCGSNIKPKESKNYSRIEKAVSSVICFAGLMALVYFFVDLI